MVQSSSYFTVSMFNQIKTNYSNLFEFYLVPALLLCNVEGSRFG